MSNEGMELPELEIDLRDESITAFGGSGGPILPVGTYTMDISDAKQDKGKSGGPVAKVIFKVADEGEHFGVELKKSYSLQTKPSREGGVPAIGRFKNLMMAAGCQLDKIRFNELIGARVLVDITHEVGQGQVDAQGNIQEGKLYCNVCNEKALPGAEPEPVAPPPAAKGKVASAPVASAPAPSKNGAVARRA